MTTVPSVPGYAATFTSEHCRCEPCEAKKLNAKQRRRARDAAESIKNVTNTGTIMAKLSQDEKDWLHLLRERLYQIGNGR